MSRWHESGCKRPDVSIAGGIPCCNYCFAIPPLEEDENRDIIDLSACNPPEVGRGEKSSLSWPSVVDYTSSNHSHSLPPSRDFLSVDTPQSHSTEATMMNEDEDMQSESPSTIQSDVASHRDVRLLRLRSGLADTPLHADIEMVNLSSPSLPRYDALSYSSAGDTKGHYPVFLGPYWDIIYVTRSCEKALRAVRNSKSDRLLWVDLLCINQNDLEDKTEQVGLMHDIYSKASSVVAYICDESPETQMALVFLQKIKAAGKITPENVIPTDLETRRSFRLLFEKPFFSRAWIVQERLLAKDWEIFCGKNSTFWPSSLSQTNLLDVHAPSWVVKNQSWYGFTGQDLLRILLNASSYKCSDPRDKIFAVLGLIYQNDITPDYRVPVESVYTGITAYMIQHCQTMDVLALAGTKEKAFNVPSWVPDWSQSLKLSFPRDLLRLEDEKAFELNYHDRTLQRSKPLVFNNILCFDHKVQINSDWRSIRLFAIKICGITGTISRFNDHTNVIISRGKQKDLVGSQGNLIVTIPGISYQISTDHVFLLSGWDHPVVLRSNQDSDYYSLISVCLLSIGPPASQMSLVPISHNLTTSILSEYEISSFSLEEENLLLQLHSRLVELYRIPTSATLEATAIIPSSSTVKYHILTFGLLASTSLREIEHRLKQEWERLSLKLRWMFLDQSAIQTLVQEIDQGNVEQPSGEGKIHLEPYEDIWFIKWCGVEFERDYSWDLKQFCCSFLPSNAQNTGTTAHAFSPVFDGMKSQLHEIKNWAAITEQLFQVFEYSRIILNHISIPFPGIHMRQKWHSHCKNIRRVIAENPNSEEEQKQQTQGSFCDQEWNWVDFESHLNARNSVWEQKLPHMLDPENNKTMAVHMMLKALDLNIYHEQIIELV